MQTFILQAFLDFIAHLLTLHVKDEFKDENICILINGTFNTSTINAFVCGIKHYITLAAVCQRCVCQYMNNHT